MATRLAISVTLCTRNRSESLWCALAQMTQLVVPPQTDWEVLIVNNASSDDTDAVVAGFRSHLPVRCVHESRPGLAYARNLAVREARGQYLLWTDDDVLVSPHWLRAYHAAFLRWPDSAVFGGPITPVFLDGPPRWLQRVRDRVGVAYAERVVEDTPGPIIPEAQLPFGANMAVRAAEQHRFLFDTRLGAQPHSHVLAEETTCLRAMFQAGARGWWVPEATVRHLIPPDPPNPGISLALLPCPGRI